MCNSFELGTHDYIVVNNIKIRLEVNQIAIYKLNNNHKNCFVVNALTKKLQIKAYKMDDLEWCNLYLLYNKKMAEV